MNSSSSDSTKYSIENGVSSIRHEVVAYHGDDTDDAKQPEDTLHRVSTQMLTATSLATMIEKGKLFFHPHLGPIRRKITMKIVIMYAIMAASMLGIYSIYWGSMMHKIDHQKYLKMLVMIEDTKTIDGVPPIIGNRLIREVATPEARKLGDWHIYTPENITSIWPEGATTVEEAIDKMVHQQQWWGALHVKKDATYNLYQALSEGNTSYSTSKETWEMVYESGRDFQAIPAIIVKNCKAVQNMILADQDSLTGRIIHYMEQNGKNVSRALTEGWLLISQPLTIVTKDLRPVTQPTVLAPAQVGLIYMILVTSFQFNIFRDLHNQVADAKLKQRHYLAYRIFCLVMSYWWLSLIYSLVSLAFQLDFTRAFGRAGFVVYWMTNWLTMTAVGTVNEIMAHVFILTLPTLIGFWLNFWVISNVAPTYTPMALTASFYRYGYAWPIYNCYEIVKVIFFDTYKGHIGRCYGVLVAWVVVSNTVLYFLIPFFAKEMQRRAEVKKAAAAAKQKLAVQEKV